MNVVHIIIDYFQPDMFEVMLIIFINSYVQIHTNDGLTFQFTMHLTVDNSYKIMDELPMQA